MPPTMRYCRACDARVTVPLGDAQCPRCGETLPQWIEGATVDLTTASWAASRADPEDAEPPQALEGQELAHYHIERFLGQGGMARVYLARHVTLERPCAIKVLRPKTLREDQHALESFLAEARASAALMHPHVVTLHTIGEADGRHYLEMEYVQGVSLAEHARAIGPLPALDATRFMVQIASALDAAHQLGMIHRDIKPANVMVSSAGLAKLADFGLAKRLAAKGHTPRGLCGTPNYMAPELFTGHPASPRSDVYAMGVTYFALLTGRLPVETQSLSELIQFHQTSRMIFDSDSVGFDLPSQVRETLQRCLSPQVNERFDAAELWQALRGTFGSLRSLEASLQEAFADDDVEIMGSDNSFAIKVPLETARTQTVQAEVVEDAETHEAIIRMFSICGPASACYYEKALHLNTAISHGAIGIQQLNGSPHFVMVNAYPRATCDPEEIRKSVLEIARHSDEVEHLLTGEDQF